MVFIKILPISGKISSDKTEQLPVTPIKGGKYIMFMVYYDRYTILAYPFTSRDQIELLRAVTKLYEHLKERGLKQRLHIIDNECSALMKKFIK